MPFLYKYHKINTRVDAISNNLRSLNVLSNVKHFINKHTWSKFKGMRAHTDRLKIKLFIYRYNESTAIFCRL